MSNVSDFIAKHYDAASKVADETGIPVARILAQAGLESGWGENAPGNNFFGIKAQPGYEGDTQTLDTTEDFGNGLQKVKQRFRAYADPSQAFSDWAKLLQQDNFKAALDPALDDAAYAKALKAGGYATDPNYASKLHDTIQSVRTALNQPVQIASPSDFAQPSDVASTAAPPADTQTASQDADLAGYGTSQPVPGAPGTKAAARGGSPSLDGLTRGGLSLMAQGTPSGLQIPGAPAPQVHRGDASQMQGILAALMQRAPQMPVVPGLGLFRT